MPRLHPPRLLAALATALLCATPMVANGQTIELRPIHSEGLELRYEHLNVTRAELPQGMGQMVQEQAMVYRSRVISLEADGSGVQEMEYESIRIRNESPMGTEAWDSTVDPEPTNPAFGFLARMLGQRTETRFGPDGQPEDLGSMFDDIVDNAAAGPERALVEEAVSGLQAGIEGTPDFLAGPITVGETREVDLALPVPIMGEVRITRRYTLERVEDRDGARVAIFAITGSMEMGEGGGAAMSGMGISMRGGGVAGHMHFDLDRGILVESLESTEMTMEVMGETMSTVTEVRIRLLP